MQRLMKHESVFMVVYLLFLIPTYILPYFGSNSIFGTLVGGAIGGLGGIFPPQWWAHMFFLASLVVIAWSRGRLLVDKGYLPILAGLAMIFDMAPVLRSIPLVPTALHVTTLVLGLINCQIEEEALVDTPWWRMPLGALGMITMLTVLGVTWSAVSIKNVVTAVVKDADVPKQEDQSSVTASKHSAPESPNPSEPATTESESKSSPPHASPEAPVAKVMEPISPSPRVETTSSPPKPLKPTEIKKPVSSASQTSAAVADFLGEGIRCLSAKRFDCAQNQAKSALRLEPQNSAAKTLLVKSQAAQQAALDGIEIR